MLSLGRTIATSWQTPAGWNEHDISCISDRCHDEIPLGEDGIERDIDWTNSFAPPLRALLMVARRMNFLFPPVPVAYRASAGSPGFLAAQASIES